MNHFYYEFRGKEKLRALVEDGLKSQAMRRSGALKPGLFAGGTKHSLGLLVGLGILAVLLAR